jgi:hypothetical protein
VVLIEKVNCVIESFVNFVGTGILPSLASNITAGNKLIGGTGS